MRELVTPHLDSLDRFSTRVAAERAHEAQGVGAIGTTVSVVTGTAGGVVGAATGAVLGLADVCDRKPQVTRNADGAVTDVHESNWDTNMKMTGVLGLMGAASCGFTALLPGADLTLTQAALFTGGTAALWPGVMAFVMGGVGAVKGLVAGFRAGGTLGYGLHKSVAGALTGKNPKQLEKAAEPRQLEASGEPNGTPLALATKEAELVAAMSAASGAPLLPLRQPD